MRLHPTLKGIGAILCLVPLAGAGPTGSPFYGDPPDERHPWAVHDPNRPQPKVVTPGTFSTPDQPGKPPSDAIILFDGTEATIGNWQADTKEGGPTQWIVKDGAMECVPHSGYVRTKEQFGDCQLHVEWAAPKDVKGDSQGRGNSGVFLEGLVEVQVLDNYNNPTYADGFASAVYATTPPLANALHPPGVFQVYDIVYRRPIFKDKEMIDPGSVTVFVNGVLTQDHTPLEGPTGHMKRPKPIPFPDAGPLKLQDHGNPVRYRNIWYRPLPPRVIEGGDYGPRSAEQTAAKRKEIAATIREDAIKLANPANSAPELLRLLESLVYEPDAATLQKVGQMTSEYMAAVKALPADKQASRKDDVKHLAAAFQYLTKFNLIPANVAAKAEVDETIKANGWDKK